MRSECSQLWREPRNKVLQEEPLFICVFEKIHGRLEPRSVYEIKLIQNVIRHMPDVDDTAERQKLCFTGSFLSESSTQSFYILYEIKVHLLKNSFYERHLKKATDKKNKTKTVNSWNTNSESRQRVSSSKKNNWTFDPDSSSLVLVSDIC